VTDAGQSPFAPPRSRGLFGLAPAPNLEGYFVAALQLPDGRWAVVHPAPEPFPNAWQRRVLLWFLLAFAIVAPLGWWFARRIVKPLSRFARAAEQLGRDPGAEVLELQGPAEIGRAARAFNLMQVRLRSYVDDRTAMIGAISHDLRTPLTRLRFRLEDIEDEGVRESMVGEVEEMEVMIASVLDFLRGASAQGVREITDLGSIVSEVVSQSPRGVGEVVILESWSASVEVDRLGIRRIVANLLENAIKYGERARVRVRPDDAHALFEVIDGGPGLPEEELEQAFEPFYRSSNPRLAAKSGTGLGLAICRSIARAHGGDVRLFPSEEGFTAQLRIPLASKELQLQAA
jgi:signal transduction histidine kinase